MANFSHKTAHTFMMAMLLQSGVHILVDIYLSEVRSSATS